MGVRFDRLAEGSQQVLEKILAEKAKQAPQRAHTEQTKPPMFTDTPTRVAPAPVQDALLGNKSGKHVRARSDSEQTPLPKPMPFHSDADEYPEEAFEEATKVRSLDELVAATAEAGDKETATAVVPRDELAARRPARAETPLAEPPLPASMAPTKEPDRESAPGLPSPPAVDGTQRKVLDTSPSPRTRPSGEHPVAAPAAESPAKTKLGVEPAKVATKADAKAEKADRSDKADKADKADKTDKSDQPRAVAAEPARPAKKPSNAPIVIGMLVVVAAGLAALWFFVLREPTAEKAKQAGDTTGSAMIASGAATPETGSATPGSNAEGSATGSAGSATTMAAGSAVLPPADGVDTIVASPTAKATIDVEGQSGAAPFTAKLEKGKQYKAHVTAPGFVAKDVFVTGGQKATIKLEPKPHVLSVTSEPAGAEIYVEGVATGKMTPADVNLTASQAAKSKLRVVLRKAGFRALDQTVDPATFTETDAKVTGTVSGTLEKAPIVNTVHTNAGTGATGTGATGTSGTSGTGTTGTGTAGTTGTGTTGTSGTGATGTGATGTSGTSGTGTSGTGTTGSSGTGTSGTGTSGTGTSGTSGTGTSGTGTSGTSGTGTSGTGAGSTHTAPSGGTAGTGEPEPDWSKKP
jgi:hypothetical protein